MEGFVKPNAARYVKPYHEPQVYNCLQADWKIQKVLISWISMSAVA